jgi:CheY-like chemotaxis protein
MSKERPHVLVADDEAAYRKLIKQALEMAGCQVSAAADGHEALRLYEHESCDLLLLDVMMPGMDGPATLAALRRLPATAATPAVFMTTRAQAQALAAGAAPGVIGTIDKPFDPKTLAETVATLWARSHGADTADGAP